MNQSKKYGIKNLKPICFLKQLLAQTCQRTTMMWPQRLFVRLETSENIHEDEKKFEKFFSRTQKYFTCQASCDGQGVWGYASMAGCLQSTQWLVFSKWLQSVWIFPRQIQIFLQQGLFEETNAWRAFVWKDNLGRVNNNVVWWMLPHFLGMFRQLFSSAFSQYLIRRCQPSFL